MPRFPKPHTTFTSGRATFRFYLGDSVDVLGTFKPGSISAVVTSPPYNLGIRYRSYDDTLPRENFRYGDRIRAFVYDVRREQRGWLAKVQRIDAACGNGHN